MEKEDTAAEYTNETVHVTDNDSRVRMTRVGVLQSFLGTVILFSLMHKDWK